MPTLIPWSSIEIGDLDVFAPSPPCLVVHTSYVDGEPESSVTYFWQDEGTGLLRHELLLLQPMGFDEALAWAQEHASTKNIERIHVRHARSAKRSRAKSKRAAKARKRTPKRAKAKRKRGAR